METIFSFLFIGFVVLFLFVVLSKRGKSLMFGGKIVKTFADEIKTKRGMNRTTIKVHLIVKKNDPVPSVGIELSQNANLLGA